MALASTVLGGSDRDLVELGSDLLLAHGRESTGRGGASGERSDHATVDGHDRAGDVRGGRGEQEAGDAAHLGQSLAIERRGGRIESGQNLCKVIVCPCKGMRKP